MKEKLDLLHERLGDHDLAQRQHALKEIKKEVSGATTSMTSVPKPLKFLSSKYKELKAIYESQPTSDYKVYFQSISIRMFID